MRDALLTVKQVAELLGLPLNTVRMKRHRKNIGLRDVKIGRAVRFRPEDIAELINAGMKDTDAKEEGGDT